MEGTFGTYDDDPQTNEPESSRLEAQLSRVYDRLKTDLRQKRWPSCYERGSWWEKVPDRFFSMMPKFNSTQDPAAACDLDIFVWLPHVFVEIKCPACDSPASRVRPVHRKVRCVWKDFVIVGWRYECRQPRNFCKKTFNNWDDRIMQKLPQSLQNSFPAVLTHRSALSRRLLSLLRPTIFNGMGPGPISAMLRELKTEEHDLEQQNYLENHQPHLLLRENPLRPFPIFSDPKTYAGVVPSANLLTSQYCKMMTDIRPLIDTRTSLLSQTQLQGDHSHKV